MYLPAQGSMTAVINCQSRGGGHTPAILVGPLIDFIYFGVMLNGCNHLREASQIKKCGECGDPCDKRRENEPAGLTRLICLYKPPSAAHPSLSGRIIGNKKLNEPCQTREAVSVVTWQGFSALSSNIARRGCQEIFHLSSLSLKVPTVKAEPGTGREEGRGDQKVNVYYTATTPAKREEPLVAENRPAFLSTFACIRKSSRFSSSGPAKK